MPNDSLPEFSAMAGTENPQAGVLECENKDLCRLKASVPTGLEVGAGEELKEVLGRPAQTSRGRIIFTLNTLDELLKVDKLRSVDNFWVVVDEFPDFCQQEDTVVERLHQLPSSDDAARWEVPLKVWSYYRKAVLFLSGVDDSERADPITFRVTCVRGGRKHVFSSNEAAGALGAGLATRFGWKVQMRDSDLDVLLRVTGDHVEVGVALNRETKFKRNITHFGPTSLRPTIAYALLRLARVRCGDLVVDPLCGGGTISIEGSLAIEGSYHLAGDMHDLACGRTLANLTALRDKEVCPLVDVLKWDAGQLPLRDKSLDVVVTDLPFGKKMGSVHDNRLLYPKVLKELGRVCRESGRAVLLTHDNKTLSRALQTNMLWRRVQTRWLNLGGLTAAVYILVRTNSDYTSSQPTVEVK